MGLIDLKTNLRSLSYGSGRGEPYITQPVPAYDEDPGNPYIGLDMFGRSGQIQRGLTDVSRLAKYLEGGKGLLFNAKQIALEKTRPNVPYGPKRSFLFSTVLSQAGVSGTGIHWDRANNLVVEDDEKYGRMTIDKFATYETNRLGLLHASKIAKKFIKPPDSNKFFITGNADQTTLFTYQGGPDSVGGIGKTTGLRIYDTTEYTPGLGQNVNMPKSFGYNSVFTLTNEQIAARTRSTSTGFGPGSISNFIQDLEIVSDNIDSKRVIGRRTNYTQFNRAKIYGTGDPGNDKGVAGPTGDLDRSTYYEGAPNAKLPGVDKINVKKIYSSAEGNKTYFHSSPDLIKFYIAVVDNNNPLVKTYIHFRAYVEGLQDNYQANWNSINYPGRGEEFFKYGGFTRDIGFSFKVHVGSRAELFPVYNKLNYLASIMAPDYSDPGFMRGNIVQLTVGDYLNDVYGVITNFSYNIPEDATFELGRKDDGKKDFEHSAELPLLINVDSFSFKPIHNFLPRTIRDLDNPESRFISLGGALNGQGYGANKRGIE